MKKMAAVTITAGLIVLASCTSIRNSLPSAPSTEGVSVKNSVPAFSLEERFRSYDGVEGILSFSESLLDDGYILTDEELQALDGRASEILTSRMKDDLFPYEKTDEPYRKLISLFGPGRLTRTEKALYEWSEAYEKALWDDFRKVEDLHEIEALRSKYSFLPDDLFESVFLSLYLRKGDLPDNAEMRHLISGGIIDIDISGKLFWIHENAPEEAKIRSLLRSSGYREGEKGTFERMRDRVLDMFR